MLSNIVWKCNLLSLVFIFIFMVYICLYRLYIFIISNWYLNSAAIKKKEHSFQLQRDHSLPPTAPPPYSPRMQLVPTMTVPGLKSLNWSSPQVQYVPKVNELCPFPSFGRDAWPPEDGAISHWMTRHYFGDEDLLRGVLQGARRYKDVTSSLVSHWDLLSGCLEAAWVYWPHLRHMSAKAWLSHRMRTSVWWHNWPCSSPLHIISHNWSLYLWFFFLNTILAAEEKK